MRRQTVTLGRVLDDMRTYSQTTPGERRLESVKSMVAEAHGQVLDVIAAESRAANQVVVRLAVDTKLTVDGTSKKTHGTGFGLPIAKRKIEDHGGSLAIDNEEDAGTTVTVALPIEAEGGLV